MLSTLIGVAAIALALVGLVMVKKGLWPRRRGDEPYCRKCGYALLGNQTGTCPECGRPWTDATVHRGLRRRRWPLGLAGVALLVPLVGMGLVRWFGTFDLYHHLPEAWLVRDIESRNASSALRAWGELARRRGNRGLSEAIESRVTEAALNVHLRDLPGPVDLSGTNYLVDRFHNQKLTRHQTDLLFMRDLQPRLRVREMVAEGEVIPIEIIMSPNGPGGLLWYSATVKRMTIGEVDDGPLILQDDGRKLGIDVKARPMPVGEWDVRMTCQVSADSIRLPAEWFGFGPSTCVWSGELTLHTKVKVVSEAAGLIKLIERPEATRQMMDSISVTNAVLNPVTGFFDLTIDALAPPENAAFSVFAKWNGREEHLVDFAVERNGAFRKSITYFHPQPAPKRMDVVFRSEPAVARRTLDMNEIWKDDVVLENVPFEVEDDKPASGR